MFGTPSVPRRKSWLSARGGSVSFACSAVGPSGPSVAPLGQRLRSRGAACGRNSRGGVGAAVQIFKRTAFGAENLANGNPEEGGRVFLRFAALPQTISFLFLSIRCARPRGGGRGFRFPLPTPSGLPTHPNDQGSGGDRVQWTKQGAAAGAALRFLQAPSAARRKNRLSARGRNPGPKRGSRSVQRPEKTIVLGPWKLSGHQMANVFFLIGLCPLLRLVYAPAVRRQRRRPRPVDDAGSRRWRSAPIFTRGLRPPPGKLAKRKRHERRPRPVDDAGSRRWRSAPIFTRAFMPEEKIG